ncbi:MAG: protein kinase [Kofleriaceae bacterium]
MGTPDLSARFSVTRRLGEGGFGTVYEARDRRFGDRVALKLLRRDHAKAIYRFKREFRSLAGVVHPNLVRLYELLVEDDALYFTMELVDGIDLMTHVCGGSQPPERTLTAEVHERREPAAALPIATDFTKLRHVFAQLANGVQALHDARKLHNDIKPSNVLVAHDGRVVLLDFGLVADLEAEERRGAVTPGYAAPEPTLTAAADWYSVGAVMFEALTGRLPVAGAACACADAELAALCSELVALDPALRPGGAEVIRRLGGAAVRTHTPRRRLFGRDAELETLRAAWTACWEAPTMVRVIAMSGLGKTALVEEFLDELDEETLILRGRCYEQESIPYKALDTIIDALGEHLRRLGPEATELLPANCALLARLFPVLRDTLRETDAVETGDSLEQRRRAFLVLRELLHRIAARRPVVVFIDDLQWGDVDSARLLLELLRPPDAPRLLVIASYRPETGVGLLDAFDAERIAFADRRIELAPLSQAASLALARELLGAHQALVGTISEESAGNPLFIQQLAAHAGETRESTRRAGLADLIIARVHELDAAARRLVETVALAGQPIEEAVALRAANLDVESSRPATLSGRDSRLLIARAVGTTTMLESAHDRIRETLVQTLAPAETRLGHRRIAEALLALSTPEPDTLVRHFRGAGDDARTREYALLAADRADHALAFDRAADYYKLILELTPAAAADRWQLLERHGGALANAGRAAESAESYEASATALTGSGRDDLVLLARRRAGELTLRSGRIPLGIQRMERVLRSVGVQPPRSRRAAGLLSVGRRLRLFARGIEPRSGTPSPQTRARLDALFSVGTGVSMANHVLADALHLQHLLESLDAGDRSHVVRGLGHEVAFESVIGGSWLRKRCDAALAQMAALVAVDGDPYLRAWTHQATGVMWWFRGDWVKCADELARAITTYRTHCHGVAWEVAMCEAYRLPALAYLGEIAKLCEIVPRAYATARELGDLFAANTLELGQQSLVHLAADRPETAIAEADAAIEPFPRETYLGPHYHHLFAIVQAALYRGHAAEAWAAVEAAWKEIEGARFLSAQCLRVEIRHLRARTALAVAAIEPRRARKLHDVALADAARIARDDVGPAAPFAAMIRAGVARARGAHGDTHSALEAAVRGFDAAHMAMYAHAARYRFGELVGGTRGSELRDGATAWMTGQGIVRPAAMIAMLAP